MLAIPPKRFARSLVTFLTDREVEALLAVPDRTTWTGRRDHAMLLLAVQTGLRVSELIGLRCADVHLGTGAHVSCLGKGRKERITPLTRATVAVLRVWLAERAGEPVDPLFPTSTGTPLSRDAVERRITRYAASAATACPSLRAKRISPHVLRHTAAMRLLQAGVDTSVIALWLGHEHVDTTRSTCTRTSPSRSGRSRGRRRPTRSPDAIDRPTRSSPSSTGSDYADLTGATHSRSGRFDTPGRHNPRLGIMVLMPTSA